MELPTSKKPSPTLDVIHAIRNYIDKATALVPGMKILLLDDETAVVVGLVYSHTEMLQRDVYLFENIIQKDDEGNEIFERQNMPHLNAFCLLRPTKSNVRQLEKELRDPKYGKYYLFFTNVLHERAIEDLARADENHVIEEVQEYFTDYFPVNDNVFTLNCPLESGILESPDWSKRYLPRIKEGIFACLLSLKMRPTIRAQKTSPLAMMLAEDIAATLKDIDIKQNYFKFKPKSDSMLFILDRCEDPVTPLLTQWTYQAMVHELLTISNNLVKVPDRKSPKDKTILETHVLSPQQDTFYKENMYSNYGDLGITIKNLVDSYQSKSTRKEDIKTIDDIRHFVNTYSEVKKFGGTVDKHVSLMLELQRQISSRFLMDLSELEQSIACKDSHDEVIKRLESIFSDQQGQYNPHDLLRLFMIYALRYEHRKTEIDRLKNLLRNRVLRKKDMPMEEVELVSQLLAYAGTKKRTKEADLFKKQNVFTDFFKRVTELRDVPNVFAQHKPLIVELVEQILTGKLSLDAYPLFLGEPKTRPQDIFIFIVGGITCEEAYFINKINTDPKNNGITLLLGGTQLHNSKSFIDLLKTRSGDISNYIQLEEELIDIN